MSPQRVTTGLGRLVSYEAFAAVDRLVPDAASWPRYGRSVTRGSRLQLKVHRSSVAPEAGFGSKGPLAHAERHGENAVFFTVELLSDGGEVGPAATVAGSKYTYLPDDGSLVG